jgi:hypothetical protein
MTLAFVLSILFLPSGVCATNMIPEVRDVGFVEIYGSHGCRSICHCQNIAAPTGHALPLHYYSATEVVEKASIQMLPTKAVLGPALAVETHFSLPGPA